MCVCVCVCVCVFAEILTWVCGSGYMSMQGS